MHRLGQLTQVRPGSDPRLTRTFSYDPLGRRIQETLPSDDGSIQGEHWIRTAYDALGRTLSVTRPEGITMEYAYTEQADTRQVTMTDQLGQATTWSYDPAGRLAQTTFPDTTTETATYDPNGNVLTHTRPDGTVVSTTYTDRDLPDTQTITLGSESIAPKTRTWQSYDARGLPNSLTIGGGPTTSWTYDSLGRALTESIDGRTLTYGHDALGRPADLTYPSGLSVTQSFDPRDQLVGVAEGINPIASFTWSGGHLAARIAGPVTGAFTVDDAGRMIDTAQWTPQALVVDEEIAWLPRGLKSSIVRHDLGAAWGFEYDKAGRLTEAATSRPLPGLPQETRYTYDGAENLLHTTHLSACGAPTEIALPTDDSGRNRRGAVGTTDLAWDNRGNLIEKGDLHFLYDAEDRLTQVRQENDDIVAHYTYDAHNRRIERTVAGRTFRTLWDGWRPIEEVEVIEGQDILLSRRVYGPGLDDIVRLEQRVGGQLETYFPVYDSLGNLAALTDDQGDLVERYLYTPYGKRTVWVDDTPPVVEQVRVEDGAFVLELSEAIQLEPFLTALSAGTVTLTNTTDATDIALAATQPITTGRLAGRRLALTPTDPVDDGDTLSLDIPASALHDLFGNPATAGITEATTYASTGTTVLRDTTPPRIEEICLTADSRLKITVSEPVDPSSTSTALPIDSTSASWTVDSTGAVLTSPPLPDGNHTLDITTAPLDVVGLGVAQASTHTTTASASGPPQSIYKAPTPGLATSSTVGVDLGMDGLPIDLETGLYYVRNRYYDPELASFVTTDPLEYVDGPNLYHFCLNNPLIFSDPMGLDAFVIKYGPDLEDVDIYVMLRFLKIHQDKAMDDQRYSRAQRRFRESAEEAWSPLAPQILFSQPAFVWRHNKAQTEEYHYSDPKKKRAARNSDAGATTVEPFVSDIILHTGNYGRSNMEFFYVDKITNWGYAHEFGHHLGLEDLNDNVPIGGGDTIPVPDVKTFGQRALDSIMGNRGQMPTSDDFDDIRDPVVSRFELQGKKAEIAPLHHLDISASDISPAVQFLELVAAERGIDIAPQLDLLEKKQSLAQRRVLARWIVRSLFQPKPIEHQGILVDQMMHTLPSRAN